MPTVADSLASGVSTGDVTARIAAEAARLGDMAGLARSLASGGPGLAGFRARIEALAPPSLPSGSAVLTRLSTAQAALPGAGGPPVGGAALAELAGFSRLVSERLMPVLGTVTRVARAVEALAGADPRCPEPEAAAPPGPPPAPPPPGPPASAGGTRLAAATARAAQVETLLGQLPEPFSAPAMVERLVAWSNGTVRAEFLPVAVPVLEDVLNPLQTLATWQGLTAPELGTMIAGSIAALGDRIGAAGPDRLATGLAGAAAMRGPLRVADLGGFAGSWRVTAAALEAALRADNPAAVAAEAAALDALVAGFGTLRAAMAAPFTAAVPPLRPRLAALAPGMADRLLHVAMQLEPANPSALVAGFPRPAPATPAAVAAFRDTFAPVTEFLGDLAGLLDLSAIAGDVAGVAAEAQALADRVSAALADVAGDVRAGLAGVEAEVAGLGLDALAAEMQEGIDAAGAAIGLAIRDGFAPLRGALEEAITALSDAADAVDFAGVAAALADVVAQISGVLQDPAIADAVAEVRATLDEVAATLRSLSFAPVTDEVVELIGTMKTGLQAALTSDLNDAAKGLLTAALAVLPDDLQPVTDPLIAEFGLRIDEGPVVLLESVRAVPAAVLDSVRAFEPGRLVGDALSAPFAALLAPLEGFRPSALLTPLEAELSAQKARLRASASPSRALAPLTAAFAELLAALDRLSPDRVLAPLEAAIEQGVRDIIAASPVDEVLAEVNGVFATIRAAQDLFARFGTTLARLGAALTALAESDAAIDAWRDGILARLDTLPDAAAVDAALDQLRARAAAARHADLLLAWDAAVADLTGDLATLDPVRALGDMVAQQARLAPLVAALPAGPARQAVQAAVAGFDPLDPAQAGPLRAAADLAQSLSAARAALVAEAPLWTGTLYAPGAALATLAAPGTTAVGLRALVEPEAEAALGPLRLLCAQLAAAGPPVGALVSEIAALEIRITEGIGDVLTGPASLATIAGAVQQVVDRLRGIDLGFLREALEGVFRALRGQIEALGPGPLIQSLDRAFGTALDAISLDAVLPEVERAALDAAVVTLVTRLRALDPGKLVTAAVQPAFERDVLPLISALDLTPVFDALIEALRGLDTALSGEMGRVNTAYQALIAARPAGGGAAAGIGF